MVSTPCLVISCLAAATFAVQHFPKVASHYAMMLQTLTVAGCGCSHMGHDCAAGTHARLQKHAPERAGRHYYRRGVWARQLLRVVLSMEGKLSPVHPLCLIWPHVHMD